MGWLSNLLGRGESHRVEEVAEAAPAKPKRPPLMLLLSDASGMAALRMLTFDGVDEACDYIEFWYPKQHTGTLFAVWALPAEPDERWMAAPEHRGEAVILVRDELREDIVYPFSFVDLATAWAFLRQEMEKDLDIDRVMIYWAVPIEIEMDGLGKVHMSPDAPPPPAGFRAEEISESTDVTGLADITVAANVSTDEGEQQAPRTRTTFVYHDQPPPQEEAKAAAEQLFEDDAEDLLHAIAEPALEKAEATAGSGMPDHDIEEDRGTPADGNGKHDIGLPALVIETKAADNQAAKQPAANNNGDHAMRTKSTNANGHARANGHATDGGLARNGHNTPPTSGGKDLEEQLARLLEARKFDRKEGPFKGFNSPPGRF